MKLADLKVDDEFKNLILPLTADELEQLEKNILEDGEVREPLVAWNGTLIDGHNRYSILKKHPEIPYKINEVVFFSRNEAIVWKNFSFHAVVLGLSCS
jgi:anti-sigma-K factor RskA